MADIDLTLAVRTVQLAQGLRDAEAAIRVSAKRMEQGLAATGEAAETALESKGRRLEQRTQSLRSLQTAAFVGAGIALRTNQKLLTEYADKSDWANGALRQLHETTSSLARSMARDLAPALASVVSILKDLQGRGESTVAGDVLAAASPLLSLRKLSTSDALRQALRADEEATAASRRKLSGNTAIAGAARQFTLDAANTPLERARARLGIAEQAAREEASRTITGGGLEGDRARATFVMLRTEALRQEVRLLEQRERLEQQQNERESRRAVNDRLNKILGEKVEKRDRELSAGRALRLEEQMTKAQELRLKGRDREADQLEIQAQFEKRIKDVVDTDFSSPAEADRYRGRLRMLMGDQLRMLGMLPPDRAASIGPGGYSAGIGRVAFGNGLGPGAAGSGPEAQLKKANQILQDISRKLDGRGATFN